MSASTSRNERRANWRALAVGQGTAGGEHVEAQLQHVVLADGAHASLGLGHLVEFLGCLQVLAGDVHLFAGQQQTEIEADGLHGHLLGFGEEARLCLAVAQWFYAAVPLQVVHAEEWLREGDGHGQRHELIARPAATRLVQIVERRLHRERAARGPQLLRRPAGTSCSACSTTVPFPTATLLAAGRPGSCATANRLSAVRLRLPLHRCSGGAPSLCSRRVRGAACPHEPNLSVATRRGTKDSVVS